MLQIYDYNKNYLCFRRKEGTRYELNLRGNVTIIDGESGSGKTLLTEEIYRLKGLSSALTGFNVDNIEIIRSPDVQIIDAELLYIIDHADKILNEALCDRICLCRSARFLIFARGSYNLGVSPDHFGTFIRENNIIRIAYAFSSWDFKCSSLLQSRDKVYISYNHEKGYILYQRGDLIIGSILKPYDGLKSILNFDNGLLTAEMLHGSNVIEEYVDFMYSLKVIGLEDLQNAYFGDVTLNDLLIVESREDDLSSYSSVPGDIAMEMETINDVEFIKAVFSNNEALRALFVYADCQFFSGNISKEMIAYAEDKVRRYKY